MIPHPFVGIYLSFFTVVTMSSFMFLGIGQDTKPGHELDCYMADYAIDAFANYIGTYQVPPEDCIAHPMEFKVMIFIGSIFCIIFFMIPCVILACRIMAEFQEQADRLERYIIVMVTVVNPFMQ